MKRIPILALTAAMPLSGCVSSTTLVQVARKRQLGDKNAISGDYHITDRDVLDFSDLTKRKLSHRLTASPPMQSSPSTVRHSFSA